MAKAVVLGEKHLVLGFKGIGFEIIDVTEAEQFITELFHLSKDREVGLVLVTESLAEEAPRAVEEFRKKSSAILTVIPTHEGSRNTSFREISRAIERSIGLDLLGDDGSGNE